MTEKTILPENNMEILRVQNFVERNKVWVNDMAAECGDGRYTKEQSRGAIRVFGGDFGFLMAVKAAAKTKDIDISTAEIVDRYFAAISDLRGNGGQFYYHTDSHHLESGIGCGHVAQATNPQNDGLYGHIALREVQELYEEVLSRDTSKLHKIVLEGEHKESAVLFVHGGSDDDKPYWSVNSLDGETGEMAFIVDIARISNFIKDLAPKLEIDGLTASDVERELVIQMQATTSLLAKGLTQYRVNIDEKGKTSVTQLAKI